MKKNKITCFSCRHVIQDNMYCTKYNKSSVWKACTDHDYYQKAAKELVEKERLVEAKENKIRKDGQWRNKKTGKLYDVLSKTIFDKTGDRNQTGIMYADEKDIYYREHNDFFEKFEYLHTKEIER